MMILHGHKSKDYTPSLEETTRKLRDVANDLRITSVLLSTTLSELTNLKDDFDGNEQSN